MNNDLNQIENWCTPLEKTEKPFSFSLSFSFWFSFSLEELGPATDEIELIGNENANLSVQGSRMINRSLVNQIGGR